MISLPSILRLLRRKWLLAAFCAVVFAGCTVKGKVDRHVKRADAYFAKADFERARLEYLNAFRLNQNDPYVVGRLGESLLERGDLRNGGALLARARDLQPTNIVVRARLASLLLMAGNLKECRQEAEAILKISPTDSDALVLLANSAANTNEVGATRKRLEALLPSNPRNSAIYLGLGVLSQKAGDLPAAEASYKEAVKVDPKSSKNNFALAAIYFARGDTNNADLSFKAAIEAAPIKSIERLGYAEFLFKCGRVPDARSLLEQTVAKVPDFVPAWNSLTQIAFAEKNVEKSAEYISKALAQDPANHDALLNQARLTLVKRDFKTAIAQLQKLAQDYPRDPQVQYQLAAAQFGNNEANKALTALDKAITLNTNNVEALLLRSQIQISRGDVDSAIPELLRLTSRVPLVPQPHYLLASAYRQRRAPDDAIAVYSRMTRLFPADPQPYQMIGGVYRSMSNLPPARVAYENALKINSDYLPAIDDLIELDILARNYDAALSRVQVYIQKYPDKPMPRLLQAKVLFAQDKNAEAEAAVKKAIELDPEFYIAHRTLADFYVRTKQTDQALAKLESMVRKNSKDLASFIQIGMLYESKNDFKRAQDAYESALKVNPNAPIALNNLAYILGERTGDIDGALHNARKAHDLAPYDPFLADTFGWMLWKKGDYDLAVTSLLQASQEFNVRGIIQFEVLYHLGMAYYMTGAIEPAIRALESSLQSKESFNGKDKAQAALAILKIDPAQAGSETISALQKAIADNPSDVLAYTKLGQIYEKQAAWDKARESYEKALGRSPKATLLLSRLAALYSGPIKNPERGLDLAKQAWSMAQTSELAASLGPIGYNAGDYKWAYGLLLEAQRSQPDNSELAYYAGLCAFALGKVPQAQDSFAKAAQANSLPPQTAKLAAAARQIATFQTGGGSAPELQAAITAAKAVDPQFPPAIIASGLLSEQNNDFTAARGHYEALLKLQPNYLLAQRQLAILLAEKLPDDAKAAQIGAAIRSEFSGDPQLAKALGKVAYRRGDFAESTRLLKLARPRLNDDPDLLYHLGLSQFNLQEKGAKANLTRAVSLDPKSPLNSDAKKALAQLK